MPVKSEFVTQPELGVLGLRENRRNPTGAVASRIATRARVGGNGALRSARGGANENTNTNIGTGTNGRRSPRLGNYASSNSSINTRFDAHGGPLRPLQAMPTPTAAPTALSAHGGTRFGVLGDITNVAANRSSLLDKAKPTKPYMSFQPPVSAAAPETVAAERGTAQTALVAVVPAEGQDTASSRADTRGSRFDPVLDKEVSYEEMLSLHAVDIDEVHPTLQTMGPSLYWASLAVRPRLPQADEVAPRLTQAEVAVRPRLPEDGLPIDNQQDIQNPQEYRSDILNQLFREETAFLPRADYMSRQTDLTHKMRTILIDWLVEVHMKYKLRPETLHLTVNLIDRYLTKMPVLRTRLQLVGVVAMFIASKFEEINPPELHDWVYITDNAYTKEDILVLECTMLTTLSFHIMVPTAAHFFEILEKANACDSVHRNVAQYVLELGLLDMRMVQYTPSQTVAAAMLLSNELLKRSDVWPATMVQQSRHTGQAFDADADAGAFRACVDDLRQLLEADRAGAGGQLQAVHKKFSAPERHGVATRQFWAVQA